MGLVGGNHKRPIYKPWTIATNDANIYASLDCKKCPGKCEHRQHKRCEGSPTKMSENYTDEMVHLIHKAWRKSVYQDAKQREVDNEVPSVPAKIMKQNVKNKKQNRNFGKQSEILPTIKEGVETADVTDEDEHPVHTHCSDSNNSSAALIERSDKGRLAAVEETIKEFQKELL